LIFEEDQQKGVLKKLFSDTLYKKLLNSKTYSNIQVLQTIDAC